MNKLVEAFKANPNKTTATRLLKYLDKHPFAVCCIDPKALDDALLIK